MDLTKLKIDRGAPQPTRRKSPWLGRLVLLALIGGAGWLFHEPALAALDRWRLPKVRVAAVVRSSPMAQAAVSGTAANGYVVARRRAALSSDAPGRIVELNVEEGTVVKEGDVVARLFSEELEAALRRSEADLLAAGKAVVAAEAREAAARRRLEEARAGVAGAEASRTEAEAGRKLAELDFERAERLLETGTDTQARFDSAQTQREQAAARLASADAELDRRRLAIQSAEADLTVATAEREQAQAQIPALEAARDLSAATLDKTNVRAPFDGVIVLKDAEVGEVVSPNAQGGQSRGSVATMVDFESLEIQVELQETNLEAARIGERTEVFIDALPGERFIGEVQRIWPTANRQKATVEVRVALEEIDPRLRPEMGARVVFAAEDEPSPVAEAMASEIADALLVPSEALVKIDGREGVFVLERDVARFREVTLGTRTSRRSVVEGGLEEGERVVLDPPARLADGDRVQVEGG
ncbi:MAG: efflux RND transporter periplasmic adaptor subunit [Planctomycetota bacterium]